MQVKTSDTCIKGPFLWLQYINSLQIKYILHWLISSQESKAFKIKCISPVLFITHKNDNTVWYKERVLKMANTVE